MKKYIIGIIIIILALLLGVASYILISRSYQSPQETEKSVSIIGITVDDIRVNDPISSPLTIKGRVSGDGWVGFEGQVGTVRLIDEQNQELATGILTAEGDWMQLPTEFSTILTFTVPSSKKGSLVFKNENASGEPERDHIFILPITFK